MITFWLPKPVTVKKARSEWFQYFKASSTTSVMEPASFRVLSMLRMGIGLERVWVGSRFALTYSWLMNIPVALESRRAFTALTSPVSVVWSSMFSLRDLQGPSISSNMLMIK